MKIFVLMTALVLAIWPSELPAAETGCAQRTDALVAIARSKMAWVGVVDQVRRTGSTNARYMISQHGVFRVRPQRSLKGPTPRRPYRGTWSTVWSDDGGELGFVPKPGEVYLAVEFDTHSAAYPARCVDNLPTGGPGQPSADPGPPGR